MSAPTLTHRHQAADAATTLRRLVADCIVDAAEASGTALVDWLAAVDQLHDAIASLARLREIGASQSERTDAADTVSFALLNVISLYDDAQARLELLLIERPDLLDVRAEIASRSPDVMDPVLHGSLADRVCAILQAPVRQVLTL